MPKISFPAVRKKIWLLTKQTIVDLSFDIELFVVIKKTQHDTEHVYPDVETSSLSHTTQPDNLRRIRIWNRYQLLNNKNKKNRES